LKNFYSDEPPDETSVTLSSVDVFWQNMCEIENWKMKGDRDWSLQSGRSDLLGYKIKAYSTLTLNHGTRKIEFAADSIPDLFEKAANYIKMEKA